MITRFFSRPSAGVRVGLVILSAALLSACQSLPSLPFMHNSAADARELVGELAEPEARDWPDMADDVLNQRARGYGVVRMPEMKRYLDGLLERIKQQAGVPQWPGSVYVIASATLDAYATAAGNIYISQSWLASATSEDEIVALLSHEFSHIYLHYHKLAEVVPMTDQAAQLVSVGASLALGVAASQGWSHVDSLAAGYMVGRDLLSTAWERSQESNADMLGLNISLRLGYSYDAGYKAFLERLASWEEEHTAQQNEMEKELLDKVIQQASDRVESGDGPSNGPASKAVLKPLAALSGGMAGLLHMGSTGVSKLWSQSTSRHPETIARMDRLTMAVDELPLESLSQDATTKPWLKAVAQRRTAAILKNYQLAIRAISSLENPKALSWARQSASGVTASHAFPLDVLYKAQLSHAAAKSKLMKGVNASAVLNRNIVSGPDRAWISYVTRSDALLEAGRQAEAKKVLGAGFVYFKNAPEVWPPAIEMLALVHGVDDAKRMAQECGQRFPSIANDCRSAARSPAERAEADRLAEQKAKSLVDQLVQKAGAL